jgi:hypothetical protein
VRATHYVLLFLSLLVSPALHGAASVKDSSFTTSDGVKLHYGFVADADRFNTVLASFLQKASLGSRK